MLVLLLGEDQTKMRSEVIDTSQASLHTQQFRALTLGVYTGKDSMRPPRILPVLLCSSDSSS